MFELGFNGDIVDFHLAKVSTLRRLPRTLETCVDSVRIGTSRNGPVVQGGWRRTRWLKRKGITTSCLGLGPSVGGASGCVGGGDDASVVADKKYGRCGGFLAPCEAGRGVRLRAEDPVLIARNVVGHDTHQGSGGLTTVSLVVSGSLSSCPPICPPPVRSAPGSSSFPPCVTPLPPAHSSLVFPSFAFAGVRRCSFFAGAQGVRPVCSVPSVSVVGSPFLSSASFAFGDSGSSVSSRGSCRSTGSYRLPSRIVASICCPSSLGQSRCCNASIKDCGIAAA